MDPRLRLQDLGAAAITPAPTTPSDLLATLEVSNPQPLEDATAALREHYDDVAKIFLCDQSGDIAQIDATTGNRIGTINADTEARLAQAGFPPGGLPAMSPEMQELSYVGRLNAAFAAVAQYTLEDCLAGSSWIGGLAQR
ncbi:hypothetical protein [Streptomyces shaanxiensis]|uniref:Uncharacterized protein n=1 Tax=Streptomyces shaanxiensis TaxID=653357 RepID=A0ABP7V0T3_9ACTN